MRFSRRRLVQSCAAATATRAIGARAWAARVDARGIPGRSTTRPAGVPEAVALRFDPVAAKELALHAVDAARAAGATYADVRLTRTVLQQVSYNTSDGHRRLGHGIAVDDERLGVGVRCLVNGYWGFAASAVWHPDEVVALARSAAATARVNAEGPARPVEWTPVPLATGDWTTPVEIDPFTVSIEEKADALQAADRYIGHLRLPILGVGSWYGQTGNMLECGRSEEVVATTEGSCFAQTRYRTKWNTGFRLFFHDWDPYFDAPFQGLEPSGRGWEVVRDAKVYEQIPALAEELAVIASLPQSPVDLGRYDVVADGWTMASLVDATLGKATELDRALGYEANASGTSYLGPDPLELLGNFQTASPLVTITADRSMSGGVATVKWDAEGVEPETATLVKDGVLEDYQTTREQAGWLRPYYEKAGKPVRSHGYAGAASALAVTLQQRPNLELVPGKIPVSLDEMIAGTKKGILFLYGGAETDFQAMTGSFGGTYCREITNGKLGRLLGGVHALFNTAELWKNVTAMGGAGDARTADCLQRKGEPAQLMTYSVRAVPAKFANVAITRE